MKKAYETPTIEKIAFNYRDQVVAASGVTGMDVDNPSLGEQIIARISQGLGYSVCEGYNCRSLANWNG